MSPSHTRTATSPTLAITYRAPTISDGSRIRQIACDSKVLDVNSGYAYLLWCAEFHETSIVAEADGHTVGFVTGYRRPANPCALMVWQVAVDDEHRGHGVAAGMLHHLFDRVEHQGMSAMHTTISPDNVASQRLFTSVASTRGLRLSRDEFLSATDFPDGHEPEDLYRLEP